MTKKERRGVRQAAAPFDPKRGAVQRLIAGGRGLVRWALYPYRRRKRRLTRPLDDWSIGILSGPSPLALSTPEGFENPVLTWRDVTDRRAAFVADPFLFRREGEWFLFFEIYNRLREKGEIAVARSTNGRQWHYDRIVLKERFHLSYPYVFECEGVVYMIPETSQAGEVRLYRARRFPFRWELVSVLLNGGAFSDPSVFRHGDRWWLFVETNPGERMWDTLRLYGAENLTGPWNEHPLSPVTRTAHMARPAGRVVHVGGNPVRFAQVCEPDYGTAVRAFEITELTPESYREREVTSGVVLGPSAPAWTATGMHHCDAHQLDDGSWVAAVDGCGPRATGVKRVDPRGLPGTEEIP
jgi:hypothetical protein